MKFSENTTLNLEYEHVDLKRSYDRGLLPINESFNFPISFNFGEPSDSYELYGNRVSVALNHRFNQNWQLKSGFSAQIVDSDRLNVQPLDFQSPFEADGRTVARRYNKVADYSRDYSWQNDLMENLILAQLSINYC